MQHDLNDKDIIIASASDKLRHIFRSKIPIDLQSSLSVKLHDLIQSDFLGLFDSKIIQKMSI